MKPQRKDITKNGVTRTTYQITNISPVEFNLICNGLESLKDHDEKAKQLFELLESMREKTV